ncbi:MAG: hypothetical protein JWN71_3921 [Xanthobacteraceae bacterium]|jgi:hypothetical protein|nr:hypothetical protein [Xanthobacteraceae bacterium]
MPDEFEQLTIPPAAVDLRRGPLGRWLVVPAGSPSNFAALNAETFAFSGIVDSILERHRKFKNNRYAAKKTQDGLRIVAEGDSWFEYPFADDLVMILGEKYPIMSLAKAGDAWADVQKKAELFPAIEKEKPHIVMLSIGGNDVMGSIETYVHSFQLNRPTENYIRSAFAGVLTGIEKQYDAMIARILTFKAHVILHGYDYVDPREPATQGAQWIGPPLKNMRHIDGVAMWREIVNLMLDRFNGVLKALAEKPEYKDRVHYVDLRNTIGTKDFNHGPNTDLWYDEIHGTTDGFKLLAAKLDAKIEQIWTQIKHEKQQQAAAVG